MAVEEVRFRGASEDLADTRPQAPVLHQSYPNPVHSVAHIRYDLPVSGSARVSVFDVLGRRVALLVDGWHAAGPHTVSFDASRLATGMYFTWLETEEGLKTRSMVVD